MVNFSSRKRESQITACIECGVMELEVVRILDVNMTMNVFTKTDCIALEDRICYGCMNYQGWL